MRVKLGFQVIKDVATYLAVCLASALLVLAGVSFLLVVVFWGIHWVKLLLPAVI